MTPPSGYALDLLSPVRHVATEMERADLDGPAPTVETMTATYEHTNTGDLARIQQHEGAGSDYEARLWLIRRAVTELGKQVTADDDGGLRLAKPFDNLRYRHRKLVRTVSEDEEDEKRALRAVYSDLAHERSFYVTVEGARGATRNEQFTLHPLARAIPPMSEEEFAALAADIKANGVKLPITVVSGKVIDGRHRLAVAAALKKTIRVTGFDGGEDDARRYIVSLNLVRRHLTMAQRGLIVREIFLPEAVAEAKERQRQSEGAGAKKVAQDSATFSSPTKAAAVAAQRSMGLANVRTIETMAPVDDAPQTRERIRRGEIKTAAEARREALKETHSSEPAEIEPLESVSAYKRLGVALTNMRKAADALESSDQGGVPQAKLTGRVAEIRAELHRLEKLTGAQDGRRSDSCMA